MNQGLTNQLPGLEQEVNRWEAEVTRLDTAVLPFRELVDSVITEINDPGLNQLGVEGVNQQIRDITGDPDVWEKVRYCSSEFRPRAYE